MAGASPNHSSERPQWPTWAGIAILVAGATIVALTIASFLEVADLLPDSVAQVLHDASQPYETSEARNDREPAGGLTLVSDGEPLSEAGQGMRLALASFHLGGIPTAILAGILALRSRRERVWSHAWTRVFYGAFVFQFGSLVTTALLFVVAVVLAVVFAATEDGDPSPAWLFVGMVSLWCLPNALVSASACVIWRRLAADTETSTRIALA